MANRIWERMGLGVRNEMRIAKEEEKSTVIKIHERHIASVVVGQWLSGWGEGVEDGDSVGAVGAGELG